jgi:hypothetical protein
LAEQEQVSGIGLGLSLDTAGFSAGIARAKAELAGLEATPVRVRTEVAVPREAIKVPITPVLGIGRQELAGFRAQIEEGLKATGGSIQVGVKLTRINFGALRAEIAAGIGTVPIKVSIAGGGKASALNLVSAALAEQGGEETQSATAFVKNAAAKRGIPTRRYGGPVAPRRTVMVGEAGPELAEFSGSAWIHPTHSARAAGGRVPNEDLRRVARQYTRSMGRPDPIEGVYHPLDPDFSRRTAAAYEAMPTHADAASRRSYRAFVDETMAQWRMLRGAGYGMTLSRTDPYQPTGGKTKMQLAAEDVRRNKNLNVFASYLDHPMMTNRENLIFRHVHDLFGHLAEGNSIGPRGEYNAAIQHSQMYSALARRAMLAETHGQNSVVNFSPTVLPGQTRSIAEINAEAPGSIYAEQKARNLPARILREFYAKAGIRRADGGSVRAGDRGLAHFYATASAEDRDYLNNLRQAHDRVLPHHVAGGESWYHDAGEFGRQQARKYGVDERTGVGILAALSAGTEWSSNKTKYVKVLQAHAAGRPFPYGPGLDAHVKAKAILEGADPARQFASSPKIGQFFAGLMGDLDKLTIDRWALRTATRGKLDKVSSGPVRSQIEQAWRQVAKEYNMPAAVSQAALWLLEKEESVRHGPDLKQGLLGLAGGGFAHASEASALARLREITEPGGRIRPGFVDEAQSINLQVERMRMMNRVESPWVRRQRQMGAAAKDFTRGFARGGRIWGWQSQPRDLMGRFGSRADEGTWFEDQMRRYLPGKREGYSSKEEFGSAFDLMAREHYFERSSRSMRSEDEGRWRARGGYIVNERGRELFVPKRLEHVIPPDVMARLPKAAGGGGVQEIDAPPFGLWSPPEDGWVIPNHLRNRIPHREGGGYSFSPSGTVRDLDTGRFVDPSRIGGRDETTYERILNPLADKVGRAVGDAIVRARSRSRSAAPAGAPLPPAGPPEPPEADYTEPAATRARREPRIGGRVGRLAADFVLPSERVRTADRLREYMEGGPQLIQGRSSVRSALAGISSYVLGGRQASAEARHRATLDIRDVAAVEGRQDQVGAARQDVEDRLQQARRRLAATTQRPGERDDAFEKRVDKAAEAVSKLRVQHEALTNAEGKLATQHKELSEQAHRSAEAARVRAPNVVQNVASIALATTAYGLVTQGLSAITAAATPALAKLVDQMGGFKSSATATTSALAEDTAARHGNAAAAIAGAAATAGLSEAGLNFVDAALRPTVQAKAGARAQGATSDLLRATVGTGAPQGLYGGYGGLGGSPILAEALGGGKGYTEQVAGDIAAFTQAQTPTRTLKDDWMTSGIPGLSQIGQALGGRTDTEILGAADRAPAALKATIDDQNAAMKRGAAYAVETASNLELTANVSDDVAKAYAATGAAAGDAQNASQMAAAHVALINKATGQAVTSTEEYAKFWQQAATGKSIADPATFMRQIAQQMTATFAGIDARVNRALTVTLPSQTAMSLISNPLVSPASVLPTGGFGAAGVTGAARGNIAASLGVSTVAQADIRGEAARGQKAMLDEVRQKSPDQLPTVIRELGMAQGYSTQIEQITNRITLEQANLSAHEFAQTMFYLNRQLSDAKGLAGEISGPNNLGSLQRSAFMVGRQQTALGLDLQQRQITTQVALAGFQAPGESPEERYARREEAQIRARTQQKQLNLSREGFGLEGQIFNVQAQRGVADTQRSIGLTQEQRNVQLDTAAANKAIDDAGRALAIHLGKAGAVIDGAGQKVEAGIGAAVDFAAQYGGTMAAATASLNSAMKTLADPQTGLNAHINQLLGAGATPPPGVPGSGTLVGPQRPTATNHAGGIVGMTTGPTHMYIGEAGRETVAILRNPRAAQLGITGGGGPTISIMVTGNTFSGPGDDQKLVQKIEAAVMSAMARKGQLLGLRGPSN